MTKRVAFEKWAARGGAPVLSAQNLFAKRRGARIQNSQSSLRHFAFTFFTTFTTFTTFATFASIFR